MCGIIAVLRRAETRDVPTLAEIDGLLTAAFEGDLSALIENLEAANTALQGVPGVRFLIDHPEVAARLDGVDMDSAEAYIADRERSLDESSGAKSLSTAEIEAKNAELIRAKDVVWALRNDRVRCAHQVRDLAGADPEVAGLRAFTSVQQALSALDRLEVRGRDSAGLSLVVTGHGLDLTEGLPAQLLALRADNLHRSGTVRPVDGGHLSFVYKAAAAIGELGDNTAALRAAITEDELLHLALRHEDAQAIVVGHTRWASVGIISEPNAHPLNSCEVGGIGADNPDVLGVLNGDVDNFADLIAANGLEIAPEISTDAKVIPTLVARHLREGQDEVEAFRCTVRELEGSVAIASHAAAHPERLLLALRGSGQALYVGLAEDCFVVASEPYGVIEETPHYVRMDGETPADPNNPVASRGQIMALDLRRAGEVEGILRSSYDGTLLPLRDDDVSTAQITTRDIDRGDYPHFLLKEINEAPGSFRKTLRGRLVEDDDGTLRVALGEETLPERVRDALGSGQIKRAIVIGQGTAAVAGESAARALRAAIAELPLVVESKPATELSGFEMRADMSDTLIIAISQSGTTTDTNRTVDLVRSRGALVVSIVNRRNSDLTDKSDGVLYTSDGRDVEMSVASTKAFYSQVAAGFLLAEALAVELGADPADSRRQEILAGLRSLPDAMRSTLELRPEIGQAAARFAPPRRYWAIVGNGMNRIAAQEVRIKLSEFCYKSIDADVTEDKKHIDLSSEPMILVCAAGLSGSTATDVAKEVAIYRAHKAAPIVVASSGDEYFGAALAVIAVPWVVPDLAFVLSAMVGHLFGYEAALAIDAQAVPLRQASMAVEDLLADGALTGESLLVELRGRISQPASKFLDGLRSGEYNGHLEAGTAFSLTSLFRYVLGTASLDSYQSEFGKVGTPSTVVEDFTKALIRATEELTRPIDAIKHQAKTVTVGISRSDEGLMQVDLVRGALESGAPRDRLSYATLKTLAALDPAVEEILGFTRYRVEPEVDDEPARATVVDRGGLSLKLTSRTEENPGLRGTKRRVASDRRVLVTRGASDGRMIVLIPEVKDNQTTGLTLLFVSLADELSVPVARTVLSGYRRRYDQLRDMVTETEPVFRDDLLVAVEPAELLTLPISSLAQRWRQP